MNATTLSVNGARLWDTIMASAHIGPGRTPNGLRRLALTDADREMRDLFAGWCRDAGLSITVDRMGNMFARRAGADDALPAVLIGSHLDTQIAGGRYDRILGVLSALEVVRTLNDAGVRTRRPIEIVNWTNEEGARFSPPMLGSAVWAGVRTLDWAHARVDDAGRTVGAELERIGYAGTAPVGGRTVDAYFELHIEQGPLLDDKGIPVGVVSGTYGVRGWRSRSAARPRTPGRHRWPRDVTRSSAPPC
jgi:beta-ureidopropionase / N-carbamoyl-L-amino-acid hydrolase